jgi:serine/threonine-protein kinase
MSSERTYGDRYRIERLLGEGGMATVYLATDLRHDRLVALKTLRGTVASTLGPDRFLREIQVTARLDHPHIVPLLDSGEQDGELFYVMPYVEGESLRELMKRERQLSLDQARALIGDVLGALEYAHARGVVHRDIKPENILITGTHARVADFGIARALAASGETLTGTGIALGTPPYMSPEQAAGERDVDRRSDIYAVGCVLYEMLAGQPPFTGPTVESVVHQHMAVPPRPVTQLRSTVPAALSHAIDKALAKAPADRFDSALAFQAAIGTSVGGAAAGRSPAWAARAIRTVGVIAGIAALALLVAWGLSRRNTPANSRPLVAVLPFRNLGAPDDEYFADGITEEITSRLGRISGIGVISRTTSTRYKGSTRSLREIARELGVEYVLEGTVRSERIPDGTGRVRITPDLIRAEDDTHVWTESYTAGLAPGEIFDLQSEIAEKVAGAFNVSLLSAERAAVHHRETADSAAYRQYLLGRYRLAQASEVSVRAAIAHFDSALVRDANYALAYAGLADAWLQVPYFPEAWVSDSEAIARAVDAARRAVALDDDAPEAHNALGLVLSEGFWDWRGAEQALQRALALDPGLAQTHARLSNVLAASGRSAEGLTEAERASSLEPTSASLHMTVAARLVELGRLDEATARYRQAVQLEPGNIFPHVGLGNVAILRGDLLAFARELAQLTFRPELPAAMAAFIADTTRKAALLREIAAISSDNPGLDTARMAWLYLAIGDRDRAVHAMERALAHRSPGGVSGVLSPVAQKALAGDPRYEALLDRVRYRRSR